MPIPGDLRAADGAIELPHVLILVEAETRLTDLQAVERKTMLKARDLPADRVILLISDTANNRRVLQLHPELRERFPTSQRACLAALGRARAPGENAIVVL